jgi:hypothetical protein
MKKNIYSTLLFVFLSLYALQIQAENSSLKAIIELKQGEEVARFQALNLLEVSVTVINNGKEPSPEGKIFIRYASPTPPFEKNKDDILFSTERVNLPSIPPHEKITIAFKSKQMLPTISDFVCHDWAPKQYQAIFVENYHQEIIGTLALTFSAYYYPLKINGAQ